MPYHVARMPHHIGGHVLDNGNVAATPLEPINACVRRLGTRDAVMIVIDVVIGASAINAPAMPA